MTLAPDKAVFDASVVLRAVVDTRDDALQWLDRLRDGRIVAEAPTLLQVEVAHVLARYARSALQTVDTVHRTFIAVQRLPLVLRPLEPLVPLALAVAIDRGVSVYDGCYIVCAESIGATLVTADRRLAAAADRAALIT